LALQKEFQGEVVVRLLFILNKDFCCGLYMLPVLEGYMCVSKTRKGISICSYRLAIVGLENRTKVVFLKP
jgi:hypothetical protein